MSLFSYFSELFNQKTQKTNDVFVIDEHLQKLMFSKTKDNIFSSYGILSVLGMLSVGLRDESLKEIFDVLLIDDKKYFHTNLTDITSKLNFTKQINISNLILMKQDIEFTDNYKSDIEKLGECFTLNNDSSNINALISEKTNGDIKDLIQNVDDLTCLVLVNVINFKAEWRQMFDDARNSTFYGKNFPRNIRMMEFKDKSVKYYEDLNLQMVALDYRVNDFCMVLMMPKYSKEPPKFDRKLFDKLKVTHHVTVDIPKFEHESEIDFKPFLENIGIKKIFDQLDEEIINSKILLKVSAVKQKCKITVNEHGTEASSGTYVQTVYKGLFDKKCREFIANKPFSYHIVINGLVLFSGKFE
jgi:serine protease inhibitor